MTNPSSLDPIMTRASKVLVGGVNSPVRAFRAVGGNPPFIRRAFGARIEDIQGRTFIDYIGSWGPAILGHADPAVVEAVREAALGGLSFGAPTVGEVELAEDIVRRLPHVEMVRLVSSGTEATMSALRLARGFTGRPLIVKFRGAYHGHADCLLVQAGSGAATFGHPDSAGVPEDIVKHTVSATYNDSEGLRKLFSEHGRQIAAVIVEPVAGNMGCVPPEPGFLETMVELCEAHGALSVFDEVMTGFRVGPAGAAGRYGIRPDITCLGKIVGGGMPLAAYGARREIMEKLSPLGPVYQAGTLSGNPLSVAAARATLRQLSPELYEHLELLGRRLEEGLVGALAEARISGVVQRVGSMITLFFTKGAVRNWDDAGAADTATFARFHRGLLTEGIYWPPSQFEAAFLGNAHTLADIDATVRAAQKSLSEVHRA
jgi:glutamate-1-semialdehyde 2,1-aminomutase